MNMQNTLEKKYVIQKHSKQNEPIHWDIMFEKEGFLETYRCDMPPEELLTQNGKLVKIFDHELRFLKYEGAVNKGLGQVRIEDRGVYSIESQNDSTTIIQFTGNILVGRFCLDSDGSELTLHKLEN